MTDQAIVRHRSDDPARGTVAKPRFDRDRLTITTWRRAVSDPVLPNVNVATRARGSWTLSRSRISNPGSIALILSKGADALTTIIGLTVSSRIVETNPLLRYAIVHIGIPLGVVGATLGVIVLVIAVTEAAVIACEWIDPTAVWAGATVRFIGYLPLTVLFTAASVNNLVVIMARLGAPVGWV